MKFSVIIPIYNAEKYINESVESVLSQTYKDFEIVLVNDGSVDNSGAICDSLKEKYTPIIKVIHQENKGQLLSRCAGAELSQGDYCVFLDADDLLYNNCLKILSEAINKFDNPDIIGYRLEKLGVSGKKQDRDVPLDFDVTYADDFKRYVYEKLVTTSLLNSMCNKCIKRDVLLGCANVLNRYSSLRCAEDRLQVLECVTKANEIVFINEVLYCYRLFNGSVTRSYDISQVSKFNMKILCEAEKSYLEKWGLNTPDWNRKIEASFLNKAMYTFCDFYENLGNSKQRTQLIRYNWSGFVPEEYLDRLDENPNVSDAYKTLWRYVLSKDYLKIKVFFNKKSAYKKLRDIKRKLVINKK